MKSLTLAIIISIMLLPFFSNRVLAQTDKVDEYEMKQYYMVFLIAGLNRGQDSTTAANIQKGHLDNITRLFNEKKLVLAGPFMDKGVYRGIFILDVPSVDEATELLKTDPAIKSGRLDYEIHPWYGPGNIVIKKSGN